MLHNQADRTNKSSKFNRRLSKAKIGPPKCKITTTHESEARFQAV